MMLFDWNSTIESFVSVLHPIGTGPMNELNPKDNRCSDVRADMELINVPDSEFEASERYLVTSRTKTEIKTANASHSRWAMTTYCS